LLSDAELSSALPYRPLIVEKTIIEKAKAVAKKAVAPAKPTSEMLMKK
jgi:hypothetical protein